jgi:uncharacterized membrane protein
MSNNRVWRRTHLLGGKLFKAVGIISLFSMVMPNFAVYFLLVPTLSATAFIFFYSYWVYRKIAV